MLPSEICVCSMKNILKEEIEELNFTLVQDYLTSFAIAVFVFWGTGPLSLYH